VRSERNSVSVTGPAHAPAGSTTTLNLPAPITSVTSFMTLAPGDLAFEVAAAMSSTRT